LTIKYKKLQEKHVERKVNEKYLIIYIIYRIRKYGNYDPTVLTKRYNAFVYIDETHALYPLHMPEVKEDKEELPETFPTEL